MILPAALRHLALIDDSGVGGLDGEVRPRSTELLAAIGELDEANDYPDGVEGLELAEYARDNQVAAMDGVREVADQLEKRRRRRPLAAAEVLGDPLRALSARRVTSRPP